jgi:ketosteroid isomerase-like protein|tara:strand:+ start:109 stop:585 length:477 start_codon:yes stop_codon:yes gene_type:complete
MNKYTIFIIVGTVMAGGCGSGATIETESDLVSLRLAANTYHQAASTKDRAAVVALYDENALMVPPNADLVEKLEGVQGYRFGFLETPGVELQFEILRAEISTSGDIGWTLSIGDITINNPEGPPGRDIIRDFHTWKKQADGSWKVVVDMWNSELPINE